jgi:hypothetical protein
MRLCQCPWLRQVLFIVPAFDSEERMMTLETKLSAIDVNDLWGWGKASSIDRG